MQELSSRPNTNCRFNKAGELTLAYLQSCTKQMIRDYFNPEEFKIAGEIPLLMKLRLKQLFGKNVAGGDRVLVIDTCLIGDFVATYGSSILHSKHEAGR